MLNRSPFLAAAFLLLTPPALAQTPADAPAGTTAAPVKPPQPAAKPAPKKKTAKPAVKPATASKVVTETAPAQGTAPSRPNTVPPPGAASAPIDTSAAALAKEKEELQQLRGTTLNLIRLLVEQGVLSQDKAEQIVREAERGAIAPTVPVAAAQAAPPPAAEATTAGAEAPRARRASRPPAEPTAGAPEEGKPADKNVVRVTYVPEVVKSEIRDQIREEVIAQAKAERWAEPSSLPEWLDRITWEGDLRLRYQGEYFGENNTPALIYNAITGNALDNTTTDDDRFRYRARIGLLAKVTDSWSAGFRLTSGNTTDPVSTNQTLGNYASRGLVTFDRAFLRWDPNERWSVSGGRTLNPYFHTDLLWDEDLSFEGVYGSYRPRLNDALSGFVTLGGYLVQHQSPDAATPDPKTKTLLGVQLGGDWTWSSQGKVRMGLAYYDYHNTYGIRNPTLGSEAYNWTAPAFRQKGNTVFNIDNDGNPSTNLFALASKFQVLNLTAAVDLAYLEPFHIRLVGDYAKNLGFDQAEIRQRTGLNVEPKTSAWRVGVVLGRPEIRAFKDWQVILDYRYLGADSVLDAFTDSDFNLGGTNAKGYTLGAQYGLDRNVWARVRWLSADEVRGPPLSIDVLQIDVNARF